MSAFIHQLDNHVLHSRHPWRRGAGLAIAVAGTVILAAHGVAALLDALESSGMTGALLGGMAGAAATAAGAVAMLFLGKLNGRREDQLMAFAAGVMLAAAIVSLFIPAIEAAAPVFGNASPLAVLLALGAGVGLMLALDQALPHAHAVSGVHGPATHASRGLLLALALFLHNFPEGMAVGIAASGGAGTVVPVALAIAVQDVPEGLLVALALGAAGMGLGRAVLLGAATGLAEPVGAWIAATVLGDNPALYPVGLAFAAGAMGFVVFHEMLPELKSRGGLPQVSGALAGGIALMLGVDLFLG